MLTALRTDQSVDTVPQVMHLIETVSTRTLNHARCGLKAHWTAIRSTTKASTSIFTKVDLFVSKFGKCIAARSVASLNHYRVARQKTELSDEKKRNRTRRIIEQKHSTLSRTRNLPVASHRSIVVPPPHAHASQTPCTIKLLFFKQADVPFYIAFGSCMQNNIVHISRLTAPSQTDTYFLKLQANRPTIATPVVVNTDRGEKLTIKTKREKRCNRINDRNDLQPQARISTSRTGHTSRARSDIEEEGWATSNSRYVNSRPLQLAQQTRPQF